MPAKTLSNAKAPKPGQGIPPEVASQKLSRQAIRRAFRKPFYSRCQCGKFEPKVASAFGWRDSLWSGREKVAQLMQTVCANCGCHEPGGEG